MITARGIFSYLHFEEVIIFSKEKQIEHANQQNIRAENGDYNPHSNYYYNVPGMNEYIFT